MIVTPTKFQADQSLTQGKIQKMSKSSPNIEVFLQTPYQELITLA